jgi:hypothetical protein
MGHTEMLLAVAGLDQTEVQRRTKQLAEGHWEDFSAAERVAFRFVRKQAKSPWSITPEDVAGVLTAFGQERGIDVLWWSARCHFMTRVADAFQLPLERDNVFAEPRSPPSMETKNP